MRILYLFVLLSVLFYPKPSFANEALVNQLQQTVQDLENLVRNQNETIQNLVVRVNQLEGRDRQTRPSAELPTGSPKMQGLSQGLNPEIGMAGTVQAKLTESPEDAEGNDTIALKELELSLAQYVDPYSRLDAVIAFNDAIEEQNVEIEEAYYTHWGLPFGFTGQVGKFRSKIGKQNVLHLHQLDTADYPLILQDFFGEEGLASSGARLQNQLPNPFDIPVEITGEVLRGNNGNSFSGMSRRPIFNTHIKTFFEPTDNTNVEFGGTALFGNQADNSQFGLHIFGADMTMNWFLNEGRAIKSQSEIYFQDREGATVDFPWGFYSLLDFRFHQKWSAGVRIDHIQASGANSELEGKITKFSPYLTLWQSEFANFRLQYAHTKNQDTEAKENNEVFLQANFLIGAHRHPVQ